MRGNNKTLKNYAKEAKSRLKTGFWQDFENTLQREKERAGKEGVAVSKVVEYYSREANRAVHGTDPEQENFYIKVKTILDKYGETSDILGRLTEDEIYLGLDYDQRQRYLFELSEKYRKALDRYRREKEIHLN